MAGWHTRLWRRARIAPGVTINLSKSGPSVSVGPRGSKVTFGRRGVRQTVGIPGTGLYATRQLSRPIGGRETSAGAGSVQAPSTGEPTAAAGAAIANPDDQIELYYGLPTVVGMVFGLVLLVVGVPVGQAAAAALLAIIGGIVYEGLAHHHPGPAKVLAQAAVGLAALVTAVLGAIAIGAIAGVLLGGASAGRRRRR